MGYPYDFHPKAEEELFEAIDYLDAQREGYGGILAEAASDTMEKIIENPKQFPSILANSPRRRAILSKPFHKNYAIYFDFDGEKILIVSFFNNRRNPRVWKDRI